MSQSVSETRRCPRCGGLMYKPSGSTLYWHADNNHPRCDITNLVEVPAIQIPEEQSNESPKKHHPKK